MDQLSLLETDTKYLHILHNFEPTEQPIQEFFNAVDYHTLKAVTFVASTKYFFKLTNEFKYIDLILGLPDADLQQNLELFDIEKRVRDFTALDEDTQEKVRRQQYQLRIGVPGIDIHSKFYLLKGDSKSRVIIGSANFSQKAFGGKTQFEELWIVDDNEELFSLYEDRFNEIHNKTIDYVPEMVKEKNHGELLLIQDREILTSILINDLEKNTKKIVIPEETMEQLKTSTEVAEEKKVKVDASTKILELAFKKDGKNKEFKLKSPTILKNSETKLRAMISERYKKKEEIDNRVPLYFDKQRNRLYTIANKDQEDGSTGQVTVPFSKPIETKEIEKRLKLIHDFVEAYDRFTAHDEVSILSKVYEVIIYGFLSPFIWKIRDDYVLHEGNSSMRTEFPPFLILSGRAQSGKTTILEVLGQLMGYNPSYIEYNNLGASNQRAKNIQAFMETENIAPLLVDEVPNVFFTGAGEGIIKTISNSFNGPFPAFIGTTNTKGFSMPPQVARRVYYLNISNTFTEKVESKQYLINIQNQLDTLLFKDFTYRMSEIINEQKEPIYDIKDLLTIGRKIFIKYYEETGILIPSYFPLKTFDDYEERGKAVWGQIFYQYKDQYFNINDMENSMVFHISEYNSDPKERENLLNLLPSESIIEDSNILVIAKDKFYNFIGYQESNKKNWLTKMKSMLRQN